MVDEPECFDDEPRADDCGRDDGTEPPCGECRVCLGALLDERSAALDVAEVKAEAWDRLVEMRGELQWSSVMQKWSACAPTQRDEHGVVQRVNALSGSDPVAVIADAHTQWVAAGRPVVPPQTDEEHEATLRHLDDWTIGSAEEIKARRAKEADRG